MNDYLYDAVEPRSRGNDRRRPDRSFARSGRELEPLALADLKLPHQELSSASIVFGDYTFQGPDFRQDAVAAANLLAKPLLEKRVTEAVLAWMWNRRAFPTKVIQSLQKNAHKGLQYVFAHPGPVKAPWQLKAVVNIPGFRQALGYLSGVGVRPEHVRAQAEPIMKTVAVCAGILAAVAVAARQVSAASESRD